jgi:hypothetical protein
MPTGSLRMNSLRDQCWIDRMKVSDSPVTYHYIMTHVPTGVRSDGATEQAALKQLCHKLVYRGDLSIDAARLELGLKPWEPIS